MVLFYSFFIRLVSLNLQHHVHHKHSQARHVALFDAQGANTRPQILRRTMNHSPKPLVEILAWSVPDTEMVHQHSSAGVPETSPTLPGVAWSLNVRVSSFPSRSGGSSAADRPRRRSNVGMPKKGGAGVVEPRRLQTSARYRWHSMHILHTNAPRTISSPDKAVRQGSHGVTTWVAWRISQGERQGGGRQAQRVFGWEQDAHAGCLCEL